MCSQVLLETFITLHTQSRHRDTSDITPAKVTSEVFNLIERHARSQGASHQSASRRSSYIVDPNTVLQQRLQHADVGHAARCAAGKRKTNCWTLKRHSRSQSQPVHGLCPERRPYRIRFLLPSKFAR